MAYYSRHSIFLYDNDKQKLLYLQTLIEEEELSFELREETVYQYDGEPLNMLCISDANYGPEIGNHKTRNDVAEELGVSPQFVSKIFSSSHYWS